MFVKVIARLTGRSADAGRLTGRRARLLDADPLSDDELCEGVVHADATVEFLFDLGAARGIDTLFERRPDLYCLVRDDDGTVLYRSATLPNVDFLSIDPVTAERPTTRELVFEEA